MNFYHLDDRVGRRNDAGMNANVKLSFTLIVALWTCCMLDTAVCTRVTIDALRIGVSDRSYAGTSGKLRFEVRQGGTSCGTIRETIVRPQRNNNYVQNRSYSKFGSCYSTKFDPQETIDFRVLSDSGDDSYIDNAALKLGGVWREWNGYQVKVNKHGEGNTWRTVDSNCTGACETIEQFRIEVSDRSYAGTSGKLRFEVRQGSKTCATARETFVSPGRNRVYYQTVRSKFGSCSDVQFDTQEDIEFRVLSDSGDDSYLDRAALKLGGVWREWNGYQVKVNKHGEGNAWRSTVRNCTKSAQVSNCTLVNGVYGACNLTLNNFTFAGAHNAGSGAFGTMRLGISDVEASKCWWQNQEISFTSMLRDYGVRFLDMDISYISESSGFYWEKGIVLIHKDAYSRSLRRALEEIDTWLGCSDNRNEILVIRIKDHPDSDGITSSIKLSLDEEFRVITGTNLNSSPNPILGDAIRKNERLVVFISEDLGQHDNFHTLKQVETWRSQATTFDCFHPDEHINRLKDAPEASDPTYLLQVDWFYSEGLCLRDMAKICNESEMHKWIQINDAVHDMYNRPVNSFMIDYVGVEDGNLYLRNVVAAINTQNVKRYG